MQKKDKWLFAGFIFVALIGLISSIYFLFFADNGTKDNQIKGSQEQSIENEHSSEKNEDSDEKNDLAFDSEGWSDPAISHEVDFSQEDLPTYATEDEELLLMMLKPLMEKGDWEGILSLVDPVISTYNLSDSDTGKEISAIYEDASTIITMIDVGEVDLMSVLAGQFASEDMLLFAPLFLPQELMYTLADDAFSLVLSQRGDVVFKEKESIVAMIEDDKGNMVYNPELDKHPAIYGYFQRNTYPEFYQFFHVYKLTVMGTPIKAYIADIAGNDLRLIGYYPDTNEEVIFKTVSFYRQHQSNMNDALLSDWGSSKD